jgi:hypothetical protein
VERSTAHKSMNTSLSDEDHNELESPEKEMTRAEGESSITFSWPTLMAMIGGGWWIVIGSC